MDPTQYIAQKLYENAHRIVHGLNANTDSAKSSLLITGIRVGIALAFHRPEISIFILQVLRFRTGSVTKNFKDDQEIQLISILLGDEFWSLSHRPEPTEN